MSEDYVPKNEMYVRLKIGEVEVIVADSRLESTMGMNQLNEVALSDLRKLIELAKNDVKMVGVVY